MRSAIITAIKWSFLKYKLLYRFKPIHNSYISYCIYGSVSLMFCSIYVITFNLHMTSNLFVMFVDNIPTSFMLLKHLYVMIGLVVKVHI